MELSEQRESFRQTLPLLFAATCSTDLENAPLDHHQVKASYLFNLLRFIEWPADTRYADDRLLVSVCGAHSLGAFLALHGARVGKRLIFAQRIKEKDLVTRTKKSHILVIGGG